MLEFGLCGTGNYILENWDKKEIEFIERTNRKKGYFYKYNIKIENDVAIFGIALYKNINEELYISEDTGLSTERKTLGAYNDKSQYELAEKIIRTYVLPYDNKLSKLHWFNEK